ncbi:MAG: exo-alpha-sialidase [Planctomycetes bacterium]|nr:exo-alpha-sialidase [Planctomycetota bacterium]
MPSSARSLFALAVMATAYLPCLASAQSRPDARLDRGSAPGAANSDTVQVACAGQTVCAVWRDQRNGALSDIYFNHSQDGGETWADPDQRLCGGAPGAAGSTEPRIRMQGAIVHVVWKELAAPAHDVVYRRSADGGRSFGPIVRLDLGDAAGASDSLDLELACEGSLVAVVWSDARNSASFVYDIYSNVSSDGGLTWQPIARRLDLGDAPGASTSLRPQVAIAAGAIHVAWEDRRTTGGFGPDVYAISSRDGGATWPASDVRLDLGSAPAQAFSTDVRLAAEGAFVCAVWEDDRNGAWDIYANLSSDLGTTWLTSDVRLDSSSAPGVSVSLDPRVAVSGGAAYVAWRDTAIPGAVNSDVHFNRSLDGGLSWLPIDLRLDDATATGATSSTEIAIVASDGQVFVAWSEAANGAHDIYVDRSHDFGSTWLPAERRVDSGDAAGASESRAVSLAHSDGSLHAAWMDRRNSPSRGDIYHALLRGSRSYGAGTSGTGGWVPALRAVGQPWPGGTMRLDLSQARGAAPAVLLLGASGRAALSFDFGTMLVAPPWFQVPLALAGAPGVAGAGSISLSAPLPNLQALLGTALQLQAAILDPQGNAGLALSAGLELWIL